MSDETLVEQTALDEPTAPTDAPAAGDQPEATSAATVEPPVNAPAPSAAAPVAGSAPVMDEMAAFMAGSDTDFLKSFPELTVGSVVEGTVVHIDRDGVLVDVGAKSEGVIPLRELSRTQQLPEEIVSIGEKIKVVVIDTGSRDGTLTLSKKRADFEKAWDQVLISKENGETIEAKVTERVKGGLVVDLGIRGFVPASHVGSGSLKTNLDKYVGTTIPLKVLEVDKERKKVVLSNKLAVEEDRAARKDETIQALKTGERRQGTVRRLTNYGAFIDLGGIDGLLHISEMSWTRINHPSEVLKEGQEVEVVILKMDIEAGRVSLGMRQILPDPWTNVGNRYVTGEIIEGKVTRVVQFGVFVQIENGIEGIIPNSDLTRRGTRPAVPLEPGQEVEVKIIDIRPEERKMTLSYQQAQQEAEEIEAATVVQEYETRRTSEEPRFTIGDAFRAKNEGRYDDED
jgi:ribosomal protein S1